ncbi:TPA: hypothetical protein N0F65_006676 [Lagenidium giganteum]|uniref:Uncharacterized protein n=1 Tax=Lagenidium giganteum TaxID=4803 RepID=A0AAV2Z4R1_9STRA|nr:TPA: hypothetical protein N0F65_006676 [Lagenidium giganteum]
MQSGTQQHHVMLLHDRAYSFVTAGKYGERLLWHGCLQGGEVPPLHRLRTIDQTAKLNQHGDILVRFAGEHYRVTEMVDPPPLVQSAFDGAKRASLTLKVASEDVVLTLTATKERIQPEPEFLQQGDQVRSCPVLFSDDGAHEPREWASAASVSTRLERRSGQDKQGCETKVGQDIPLPLRPWYAAGHRRFCASNNNTNASSDGVCIDGKKVCLLVHGLGVPQDVGVVDDFPSYWGATTRSKLLGACCSDVKFTHMNSVDTAWQDERFARQLCDAAVAVAANRTFNLSSEKTKASRIHKPKKPQLLQNIVVVTHSAGAMHVASTIMQGYCQLDKLTTKWIAIEGPMSGTNTANEVLKACNESTSDRRYAVQAAVSQFNLCPPKTSTLSFVLARTNASNPSLDAQYEQAMRAFRSNVNASLCGTSPFGIPSTSSAKFVVLADMSHHNSSLNDGVVVFSSCRGGLEPGMYLPTYQHGNRFYEAKINHDDGRLINGDGVWGDARKPVKWLLSQV